MPHGFVNLLMQDWLPGSFWRGTWRKILRRRCFFVKSLHVQRSEKEPKWAVKSTLWLWWFWAQELHNHWKSLQRVVSNCGMVRLGQRTDNDFNPSGEFLSGMRFASKSCIKEGTQRCGCPVGTSRKNSAREVCLKYFCFCWNAHKSTSQKMPNHTNTWDYQTATTIEKSEKKNEHERHKVKRWCILQMSSSI